MDDEWEAVARRAGAHGDRAVRDTPAPHRFRLDEDITREMGRLAPLLDADISALAVSAAADLDPPRREFLASVLDPSEYDLPQLRL